jgi:hypothetical protein
MRRIRRHLTFANVASALALCVALGTGGAWAAATIGPGDIKDNAVRSRHIDNHAIHGPDIAGNAVGAAILADDTTGRALTGTDVTDNSLGGTDVTDNSLGSADVTDNSLTGADVADGTLGGADISEGTLAEVPSAKVGGFGRKGYGGSCYPNGAAYVDCVVLTVNLPTQSKVLLIGATEAFPQNGAATGACKLVTQFGDVPNTAADYHLPAGAIVPGSLVGITGPLGPGPVDFGIDCNKFSGTMEYFANLAAIQIAPD